MMQRRLKKKEPRGGDIIVVTMNLGRTDPRRGGIEPQKNNWRKAIPISPLQGFELCFWQLATIMSSLQDS
jgi:hypothetical protein